MAGVTMCAACRSHLLTLHSQWCAGIPEQAQHRRGRHPAAARAQQRRRHRANGGRRLVEGGREGDAKAEQTRGGTVGASACFWGT